MRDNQTIDIIKSVWEDVLGLPKGSCADEDHFWLLGGNSLTMLRVLARLEKLLVVGFDSTDMSMYSTPVKLAQTIELARSNLEYSWRSANENVEDTEEKASEPGLHNQPLSLQQQALWYVENSSVCPLYNNGVSWHIRGEFQVVTFTEAFNAVVARHEILRSSFHPDARTGMVVHRILPCLSVDLMEEVPEADPDKLIQLAMDTPFDLGKAPLFRLLCFRLEPQHVQLVLVMHHSITDGWSGHELARELWSIYQALQENRSLNPAHVAGYGTYCRRQRLLLRQKGFAQAADYWLKRLQGMTMPQPSAPREEYREYCENEEPDAGGFRAGVFTAELDARFHDSLRNTVCTARQCSLFELCCTTYILELALLRNEQDPVIGIPVANRSGDAEMCSQGLFVNTLPFRLTLENEMSLQEVLQRSIDGLRNDLEYQHMPLSLIAELVQGTSTDASPDSSVELFQDIFVYQNFSGGELPSLTGSDVESVRLYASYCQYPLNLEIDESAGKLAMTWQYHRLRYTEREVAAMHHLYTEILKRLAFAPDLTLTQLRQQMQTSLAEKLLHSLHCRRLCQQFTQ